MQDDCGHSQVVIFILGLVVDNTCDGNDLFFVQGRQVQASEGLARH